MADGAVLTAGSFAVVWIGAWLMLTLLLLVVHRLLRPLLLALHPAGASAVLLTFCAAPLLMSLSGSLLLYLPVAESALVGPHCHEDCSAHVPLTTSLPLALLGLAATAFILLLLSWRVFVHLRESARLTRQLRLLSGADAANGFRELESDQPLVFTLGWLRPEVYVSRGLRDQCDGTDLQVILAHERAHRLRLDNLRMLLGRLLCLVAPPAFKRRLLDDLELLSEQACDFSAAQIFGTVPVAETLVRVKRIVQSAPAASPVLQRFTGAEVETRVHALLNAGRYISLGPARLSLLLFLILVFVLLGVEPLHHGTEWILSLAG
ncbi:MAG: M56 family metallopeptidase [Pseudohongiellaceae bacterium]